MLLCLIEWMEDTSGTLTPAKYNKSCSAYFFYVILEIKQSSYVKLLYVFHLRYCREVVFKRKYRMDI